MEQVNRTEFQILNGVLRFGTRLCAPNNQELKNKIMREAHYIVYTAHPGRIKMYQDLKYNF